MPLRSTLIVAPAGAIFFYRSAVKIFILNANELDTITHPGRCQHGFVPSHPVACYAWSDCRRMLTQEGFATTFKQTFFPGPCHGQTRGPARLWYSNEIIKDNIDTPGGSWEYQPTRRIRIVRAQEQTVIESQVIILVPSLNLLGLSRGAVALANSVGEQLPTKLISLTGTLPDGLNLSSRVEYISLEGFRGFLQKSRELNRYLHPIPQQNLVVSMGLKADLLNWLQRRNCVAVSSIRGNLFQNYKHDMRFGGKLIARLHYWIARKLPHVVAISQAMGRQLRDLGFNDVVVIGNFIDEKQIVTRRNHKPPGHPYELVFVGGLTERKRVDLAIRAVRVLRRKEHNVRLHIVGDGPLLQELKNMAGNPDINDYVHFHGRLDNPFSVLRKCDLFLLPSESEGVSRAAMEALYMGIPCLLRNVEAAPELIQPGVNGNLFTDDSDFLDQLIKTLNEIESGRINQGEVLLPAGFRQENNAGRYLSFLSTGRGTEQVSLSH